MGMYASPAEAARAESLTEVLPVFSLGSDASQPEMLSEPISVVSNLSVPDGHTPRYARVSLSLGVRGEDALKKIESSEVVLKDVCTRYFSGYSFQELGTMGPERIKKDLHGLLEEKLELTIQEVYLAELLLQ